MRDYWAILLVVSAKNISEHTLIVLEVLALEIEFTNDSRPSIKVDHERLAATSLRLACIVARVARF